MPENNNSRKKIVAGNWKMNGTITETTVLVKQLVDSLTTDLNCEVIICPPFTALETAKKLIKENPIALGGQEVSEYAIGAYTGEISAEMLLTVGVSYVILGHSERRQYHQETDQRVNKRAKTALSAGLSPIICVGETLKEREDGKTSDVIRTQIEGVLDGLSEEDLKHTIIAYEPVWAIGTGKTASPEMAEEVHRLIRLIIASKNPNEAELIPIIYGGSVKPENASELLSQPNIDGALVGGASLVAEDFLKIINFY